MQRIYFELLPTVDIMLDLYQQPISRERFDQYLNTIRGDTKSDLSIPLVGYNPMAKAHVKQKLEELKELLAEDIIAKAIEEFNTEESASGDSISFQLALNLSDDLKGGWTNRYTSDYDGKFRISGLMSRSFCVPVFWTSEVYAASMIRERTLEYIWRSIYWLGTSKPKTLEDHFKQELFVVQHVPYSTQVEIGDTIHLEAFYNQNLHSENYQIIFNFFYGDAASNALGFVPFGNKIEMGGFAFARWKAERTLQ